MALGYFEELGQFWRLEIEAVVVQAVKLEVEKSDLVVDELEEGAWGMRTLLKASEPCLDLADVFREGVPCTCICEELRRGEMKAFANAEESNHSLKVLPPGQPLLQLSFLLLLSAGHRDLRLEKGSLLGLEVENLEKGLLGLKTKEVLIVFRV